MLARLRARADDGTLSALSETRVEQSWNEQIFARVLGYRTLFSHDRMPYHLDPKRPTLGQLYTDFVLGAFGAGDAVVVASAELKSPNIPLDKKQKGKPYYGSTPVEQAHKTAAKLSGCRWVLVSNYDETRLYELGAATPICTARLFSIRTLLEVADFAAHFDREALIGPSHRDPSRLERILAMNDDHPGAPVPPQAEHVRLVARLTLAASASESLYDIERDLRVGLTQTAAWGTLTGTGAMGTPKVTLIAADGWVAAEAHTPSRARLAKSVMGETVYSIQVPLEGHVIAKDHGKEYKLLALTSLTEQAKLIQELFAAVFKHASGTLSIELLDVKGIGINGVPPAWLLGGSPINGRAAIAELVTTDFIWKPNVVHAMSRAIAELLVQFRSKGAGVLVDLTKLAAELGGPAA